MFEITSASVLGRDHVAPGKNNQDAVFAAVNAEGSYAGVVCDGCGSSPHSEVGAQLGARMIGPELLKAAPWIMAAVAKGAHRVRLVNETLERIRQNTLAHIRLLT